MGQKGHIMDQKGLKMHEKRQKIEFSNLKYLLFSGIFLSGIGGYPPPPLNGKSSCPKTLSGNVGYPFSPLPPYLRNQLGSQYSLLLTKDAKNGFEPNPACFCCELKVNKDDRLHGGWNGMWRKFTKIEWMIAHLIVAIMVDNVLWQHMVVVRGRSAQSTA